MIVHNGKAGITVAADVVDGLVKVSFAACNKKFDNFTRVRGREIAEKRLLSPTSSFTVCAWKGSNFRNEVFIPIIRIVKGYGKRRNFNSLVKDVIKVASKHDS